MRRQKKRRFINWLLIVYIFHSFETPFYQAGKLQTSAGFEYLNRKFL